MKKSLALSTLTALLLSSSALQAATVQDMQRGQLDVQSPAFFQKLQRGYESDTLTFSINPVTYEKTIQQLHLIQDLIAKNHPLTLKQAWEIESKYMDLLFHGLYGQTPSDLEQTTEITQLLFAANAMFGLQPSMKEDRITPRDTEDQYTRLKRLYEKYDRNDPSYRADAFKKLAVLNTVSIISHSPLTVSGLIDNQSRQHADYTPSQEFISIFGGWSKYPTSYLNQAKQLMREKGYVYHEETEGKACYEIQIMALLKACFSYGGTPATTLEGLNTKIRTFQSDIVNRYSDFSRVYFWDNAPVKFLGAFAGGLEAQRVLGQYHQTTPTNGALFKAISQVYRILNEPAYHEKTLGGPFKNIGISAVTARQKYLEELIAQSRGNTFTTANLSEINNFSPDDQKRRERQGKQQKTQVHIIDNFSKLAYREKHPHGQIVADVFDEYSNGLRTIQDDISQGGSEEQNLISALSPIRDSIISISLGVSRTPQFYQALKQCIQNNNLIFLAVDNAGKDLSSGQDWLTVIIEQLRAELGAEAIQNGLRLIARVDNSPTLEWRKSGNDYFARFSYNLASQGFGKADFAGDIGALIQSIGLVAGGEYYKMGDHQSHTGTSFATPAVAGAVAQAIEDLQQKDHNFATAKQLVLMLLDETLKKHDLHIEWSVATKQVSVTKAKPFDRAKFGSGLFDYGAFIKAIAGNAPEQPDNQHSDSTKKFLPHSLEAYEGPYQPMHATTGKYTTPFDVLEFFDNDATAVTELTNTGSISYKDIEGKTGKFSAVIDAYRNAGKNITVTDVPTLEEALKLKDEGVTVSNLEDLLKKKALSADDLSALFLEEIKKSGVVVKDVPDLKTAIALHGKGIAFEGFRDVFEHKRLPYSADLLSDPAVSDFIKTQNITVTNVPDLKTAIALHGKGIAFEGFTDVFKHKRLPYYSADLLSDPAVSDSIKTQNITVTNVPDLKTAIALHGKGIAFEGFTDVFKHKRLPYSADLLSDPAVSDSIKTQNITVTDVPDLKTAIALHGKGIAFEGFTPYSADLLQDTDMLEFIKEQGITVRDVPDLATVCILVSQGIPCKSLKNYPVNDYSVIQMVKGEPAISYRDFKKLDLERIRKELPVLSYSFYHGVSSAAENALKIRVGNFTEAIDILKLWPQAQIVSDNTDVANAFLDSAVIQEKDLLSLSLEDMDILLKNHHNRQFTIQRDSQDLTLKETLEFLKKFYTKYPENISRFFKPNTKHYYANSILVTYEELLEMYRNQDPIIKDIYETITKLRKITNDHNFFLKIKKNDAIKQKTIREYEDIIEYFKSIME